MVAAGLRFGGTVARTRNQLAANGKIRAGLDGEELDGHRIVAQGKLHAPNWRRRI